MAIRLQIHDYQLGDVPDPKNLLWDEGASQWGYSRNQMVNIPGIAVEENGDWWLQRDGTNQSIRLSPNNNTIIGIDSVHTGYSHVWNGRLMEVEDPDLVATVYHLINADVIDFDGDGLSDNLESLYGTNRTTQTPMVTVKTTGMTTTPILTTEAFMFEAYFVDLGWLLFALFFGVIMGSLTGLIPGFHVNNVALILLALSPVSSVGEYHYQPWQRLLYQLGLYTHS